MYNMNGHGWGKLKDDLRTFSYQSIYYHVCTDFVVKNLKSTLDLELNNQNSYWRSSLQKEHIENIPQWIKVFPIRI